MLKCRELIQETTANPEILSQNPRFSVRLHLLICRNCRRYLRQLKAMIGLLAYLQDKDAHQQADEQTVAGIWRRIKQAGQ